MISPCSRIHRPLTGTAVLVVLILGLSLASATSAQAANPLTCSPCNLDFGSVSVGSSKVMAFSVRNASSRSLRITRYNKSAPGFRVTSPDLPVTLAAGQSRSISVIFQPTSTLTVNGKVWIESSAASIGLPVGLKGTSGGSSGALTPNPSTVNFGSVPVGSSKSNFATLTNRRGSSVRLTGATITGAGFTMSGLNLPLTLNGGQSVTFTTKFTPRSTGSASGKVSVSSTAGSAAVNLTGTGTGSGALSTTPSSLAFGTVTVGSQKSLTGTLKASGSAVTVTSGSTGSSEFTLSGISFPLNLSAGQSVSYTVKFAPASSGAASANLRFSASGASAVQSLAGTGSGAAAHSVTLSWNRSSSSSVVGYNVYRGTTSGGPYNKVNSSLESSAGYVDNSVSAGQTYYYVVTAVDGGGRESGFSNQVKAIIPTP